LMWLFVRDGPYDTAASPFSVKLVGAVMRNRGVRLSTYGYLGHMWELYAMWAWTAAFLLASAQAGGYSTGWVSTATFAVIAIGGVGSWWAGTLADRFGRERIAAGAMAISGTSALLSPFVFGRAPSLSRVGTERRCGFSTVLGTRHGDGRRPLSRNRLDTSDSGGIPADLGDDQRGTDDRRFPWMAMGLPVACDRTRPRDRRNGETCPDWLSWHKKGTRRVPLMVRNQCWCRRQTRRYRRRIRLAAVRSVGCGPDPSGSCDQFRPDRGLAI